MELLQVRETYDMPLKPFRHRILSAKNDRVLTVSSLKNCEFVDASYAPNTYNTCGRLLQCSKVFQ